jgi:hypothetical protein
VDLTADGRSRSSLGWNIGIGGAGFTIMIMNIALPEDLSGLLQLKGDNGQFPNVEAIVEEAWWGPGTDRVSR